MLISSLLVKDRFLLATLNFRKLNLKCFRNQLRNNPHLHIKRANKLKMRFIQLKLKWTCWVL